MNELSNTVIIISTHHTSNLSQKKVIDEEKHDRTPFKNYQPDVETATDE